MKRVRVNNLGLVAIVSEAALQFFSRRVKIATDNV